MWVEAKIPDEVVEDGARGGYWADDGNVLDIRYMVHAASLGSAASAREGTVMRVEVGHAGAAADAGVGVPGVAGVHALNHIDYYTQAAEAGKENIAAKMSPRAW